MIELRVDIGPDDNNNCLCTVLKSDSTHELIRGSVNVDFTLCNPRCNITPGDVVVINRATVYTVIAGEIVNIEHNEA